MTCMKGDRPNKTKRHINLRLKLDTGSCRKIEWIAGISGTDLEVFDTSQILDHRNGSEPSLGTGSRRGMGTLLASASRDKSTPIPVSLTSCCIRPERESFDLGDVGDDEADIHPRENHFNCPTERENSCGCEMRSISRSHSRSPKLLAVLEWDRMPASWLR